MAKKYTRRAGAMKDRISEPAVHATVSEGLKIRLITAAIYEGKDEATIIREIMDSGLTERGYPAR